LTETPLPRGLGDSFQLAAADLGQVTASWLFVREIAGASGAEALFELRDQLGRTYPVLDAVAREWLDGVRGPDVRIGPVLDACRGASRIVVVGLEAEFLDVLERRLAPEIQLVLLEESALEPDWARVRANFGRRVVGTSLSAFQRHGGRTSVLLTFGYGSTATGVYVPPAWLRVIGSDVRTQFRSIVLWNTLAKAPFVFPRWLVDAPLEDFTDVVSGG
jgi:hypothetical protein